MRKQINTLWRIFFILLVLLLIVVLELGRHTVIGWVLVALVFGAFYYLRSNRLKESSLGKRFLSWICLLAVCALVLLISYPPIKAVPAVEGKNPETTDVIHLSQGDISGVYTQDKKVEVYAGIPYAKPPVGELRWKEPQAAEPWEGVLKADHFAPMSMQMLDPPIVDSFKQIFGFHDYKISLSDNYRTAASEDSLYLNVWRPAKAKADKLPVLVFIHGGSLQNGQTWYKDYNGEGLAKDGVIVVNMAYRLGIFGFFADPELAEESPNHTTGNYGLLDQICALQWVRDNIESFGGDPDNVTIAGESAGSASVSAICTSPLAKGLFRRVIMESSTVTSPKPSHSFRLLDEAFDAGEKTKEKYGANSVEDLRALPAEDIVEELSTHHHIAVDGYALKETPYESYKKGEYNEEAQIHGFNREESAPFILFEHANLKNYEEKIRGMFEEPYASRVLESFPAATDNEADENWMNIYSVFYFDYGHYCDARLAAENNIPSYMYYFTKDNGRLGTWHTGEIIYFYGNVPPKSSLFTNEDRALSDTIKAYIVNFARSGDPNVEGLEKWRITDGNTVQEFGTEVKEVETPYLELYGIMDEMYGFK